MLLLRIVFLGVLALSLVFATPSLATNGASPPPQKQQQQQQQQAPALAEKMQKFMSWMGSLVCVPTVFLFNFPPPSLVPTAPPPPYFP